jgi:hypothetical protein
MFAYADELAAATRRPADDVMSALVMAEIDGERLDASMIARPRGRASSTARGRSPMRLSILSMATDPNAGNRCAI